jgi:hypothetical protein
VQGRYNKIESEGITMEKGKFYIDINVWKQTPKSRRRARTLEEREGWIDTENNIGYMFNSYGDCRATDLNTGLSIYSCNGKTLGDCIEKYGETIVEVVNKARSLYYYDNCVKLFEYLKTCTEPVTEQKLAKIFA